jgi:multiple sugar transport system permease protein
MGRLRTERALNGVAFTLLALGSIMMLLPFYWMVVTSIKVPSEVITFPPTWLPSVVTFEHYGRVFGKLAVGILYRNSAVVAVTKTILMVFTSSLTGYIFGKFTFRGRDIIFSAIIATMIIPLQVYMIPLYLMMVDFQWHNTYTGLVVPYVFSAYAMFLVRQYMHSIPSELLDAARIDGAGELYIFVRLVMPLSKAVLATLVIFYFMWNWNDFLWPLVVLNSPRKYTLPIGLTVFNSEVSTDYGATMAAAAVAVIPVMVVFFVFQRHIVEGVALTGLKG